jgi:hypothetical protein
MLVELTAVGLKVVLMTVVYFAAASTNGVLRGDRIDD